MFWYYKLFAKILSWAEQSDSQLSDLLLVSSLCTAIPFQLFDIWWSSFDLINYFKAISSLGFFHFGEINRSLFWIFSKKPFFIFFIFYISRDVITNQKKLKKDFFLKNFEIIWPLAKTNCQKHNWAWNLPSTNDVWGRRPRVPSRPSWWPARRRRCLTSGRHCRRHFCWVAVAGQTDDW